MVVVLDGKCPKCRRVFAIEDRLALYCEVKDGYFNLLCEGCLTKVIDKEASFNEWKSPLPDDPHSPELHVPYIRKRKPLLV